MIYVLIACLVLVVGIALIFAVLWRMERRRRKSLSTVASALRGTAQKLHDQVPFPYGERLP